MRPLTPIEKTAFIFYLAYAGLLLLFSFWNPVQPVTSGQLNLENEKLGNGQSDFTNLQSSFEDLWGKALSRKGWDRSKLLIQTETKLEEDSLDGTEVKWVNTKSKFLLPDSATKQDLVELVTEWESINHSLNLKTGDLKWGYQRGQLWLRLNSELSVNLTGGAKRLPVQEITLLTPNKATVNRQWPGLIPRLPPSILPPVVEPPKDLPVIQKPRVALIIDDVGSVRKAADAMLQVPARLTWAILPFTPYAAEYAEAAKEQGFEVILHLPLEPLDRKNNPGPGLIKRDWTDEEIVEQLEADLNQVPGAVGINNHMGSAGTADERLMDLLMGQIKERDLYFVDSMTTDRSVGEAVASRHQVRFKKRHVFIDNLPDIDSKKKALQELIKVALAEGEAIGIGHVREGTAEAIIEMIPEFEKAGIELVTVSELLDR
ncbi:MAG: divergent polysaccharide deacetylase family protein [Bacteroidota bacterium]